MTYRFREFYVPERMMTGIENYVLYGIAPGGFLSSIIKNDLRSACELADDENLRNIPAFVAYFYNAAPAECWGGAQKMDDWIVHMKQARARDATAQPVVT